MNSVIALTDQVVANLNKRFRKILNFRYFLIKYVQKAIQKMY
jgi:hypothetical protein